MPNIQDQQEFNKRTAFASTLWLSKNWSFPCPNEYSNRQKAATMQEAATTDVRQNQANSP